MRTLFKICILIFGTNLIYLHAQDTTMYRQYYQSLGTDTCSDKIVHHWVGCGHPEHYVQMCDGHKLEILEVYDRWGTTIFSSANELNYIELRDKNGSLFREDIYIYRIKYRTLTGELKTSTGQFTFIP